MSVNSQGGQANNDSAWLAISPDGRFVEFTSSASNLVNNDTNGVSDIFVHDRQTGETTRVSVNSQGGQRNGASGSIFAPPAISGDGRFVAFQSYASNLVPGDTNGYTDIFVHDRQPGETTRVSVDSRGVEGNGESMFPLRSGRTAG